MNIRLNICIHHKIYRQTLINWLKLKNVSRSCYECESMEEAMAIISAESFDVMLIDADSGPVLPLIQHLRSECAHLKVILLLHELRSQFITDCVRAGIEGLVTQDCSTQDLQKCILEVYAGRMSYPSKISNLLVHQVTEHWSTPSQQIQGVKLTPRQKMVMNLLETGHSNKEIARILGVELATVKNHVHQILERLSVTSRMQAVAEYRRSQDFLRRSYSLQT